MLLPNAFELGQTTFTPRKTRTTNPPFKQVLSMTSVELNRLAI